MAIHLLVSVIVVGLDGFHELSKCTFVLTRSRGEKEKKKKKREKMVNAVPTLVFR